MRQRGQTESIFYTLMVMELVLAEKREHESVSEEARHLVIFTASFG